MTIKRSTIYSTVLLGFIAFLTGCGITVPHLDAGKALEDGPYYYACGQSERFFESDKDESDQELYSEATVDAKGVLLKHLLHANGRKSGELQASGVETVRFWSEGKLYKVIIKVPKQSCILKQVDP